MSNLRKFLIMGIKACRRVYICIKLCLHTYIFKDVCMFVPIHRHIRLNSSRYLSLQGRTTKVLSRPNDHKKQLPKVAERHL